jgi:hypothetical protein
MMDLFDDDDLDEDDLFEVEDTGTTAPAAVTSGRALGQARPTNNMLNAMRAEAQRLAMLKGKPPTMMDGIMAGLAAKTGRASTNGTAAFLDGFVTSGAAAYQGRKAKDDTDARHKRILNQLTEERKAENDNRRTRAYEHRAYRGGTGRGGRSGREMHPLDAEAKISATIARDFKHDIARLEADATELAHKRMKPEDRQAIVDRIDKERARLRSLYQGGAPAPADPQAGVPPELRARPRVTPGPTAPAAPRHAPGPQTPRAAIPKGMTRDRARAATQEALRRAPPEKRQEIMDKAQALGLL